MLIYSSLLLAQAACELFPNRQLKQEWLSEKTTNCFHVHLKYENLKPPHFQNGSRNRISSKVKGCICPSSLLTCYKLYLLQRKAFKILWQQQSMIHVTQRWNIFLNRRCWSKAMTLLWSSVKIKHFLQPVSIWDVNEEELVFLYIEYSSRKFTFTFSHTLCITGAAMWSQDILFSSVCLQLLRSHVVSCDFPLC